MVARILAKLSAFVQEYSRNICCEFYSNNCDGSTDTAVLTLNFNFSSEHAVAHSYSRITNKILHSFSSTV